MEKGVALKSSDVEALFVSSNVQMAIRFLEPEGSKLKIDAGVSEEGPTVLHYIAKGNGITALKEYLLAKAEANQPVPIAKSAVKDRNFLHWAGWFSAAAILDFWAIEIGNVGLDQIDAENFVPSAFAYIGLYDPIDAKSPLLSECRPEYVAVRNAAGGGPAIGRRPNPA
jgi:hypothetical protein